MAVVFGDGFHLRFGHANRNGALLGHRDRIDDRPCLFGRDRVGHVDRIGELFIGQLRDLDRVGLRHVDQNRYADRVFLGHLVPHRHRFLDLDGPFGFLSHQFGVLDRFGVRFGFVGDNAAILRLGHRNGFVHRFGSITRFGSRFGFAHRSRFGHVLRLHHHAVGRHRTAQTFAGLVAVGDDSPGDGFTNRRGTPGRNASARQIHFASDR